MPGYNMEQYLEFFGTIVDLIFKKLQNISSNLLNQKVTYKNLIYITFCFWNLIKKRDSFFEKQISERFLSYKEPYNLNVELKLRC